MLNTALAQGSIALGQLQRDSARLTDTAGNLQEQIDRSSASGALARSAAQLGMVRMSERGYIDLAAGTVTGEPKPATKDLALPIVTSPTPLAVTKEVKGLLSSASSVATKAQTSAQQAAARRPQQPRPPRRRRGGGCGRRHADRARCRGETGCDDHTGDGRSDRAAHPADPAHRDADPAHADPDEVRQ